MNSINKTVSEGMRQYDVQKMMQHFEHFNFMKYIKGRMTLGYNGEYVRQAIHNEWLISNSVMCDEPSFLSSCVNKSNLKNVFNAVESLVKDLPCSIISSCRNGATKEISGPENPGVSDKVNSCFNQNDGLQLQRYLICNSHTSDNFFYKLQRDRQKWWKKFSASPEQFTMSQVFNDDGGQYVEIQVEFPWGVVPVERIKLLPDFLKKDKQVGSKPQSLHVVTSETILEKSAFALIFDSYEKSEETGRQVLRFHRKIAPYKVAMSTTMSTPEDERNLKDLALLLTKQIRKNYISVLLLSDVCSTPLEEQIVRNDSLGIPYTVIMTGKTLKTGLLEIRSRNTTLSEQSHVGSLAPYVDKLMKYY